MNILGNNFPAMLIYFKNLFWHHHSNNHKPRIIHLSSLTFLVIFVVIYQVFLTCFTKVKPGVLGFASNVSQNEVIALTNMQREKAGLPSLKVNSLLTQAAQAKADYMFAQNFWAHNSPDGTTPWFFFKQMGYNYRYAGENLARDFSDSSSIISAWMNSPTHRDNILSNRYDEIGVVVVNGILQGQETTLVIQMFGKSGTTIASISNNAAQAITVPEIKVAETKPAGENVGSRQTAAAAGLTPAVLSQPQEEYTQNYPLFSVYSLTKSLNIALAVLVIIVLTIDSLLVWKKKKVRISGKSFVHLSLFALIALLIFLSGNGQIL